MLTMNRATRVLALDLDDTLLRSDKSVSTANLAAIERWLAFGHEIIVATGRPPRSVEPVLPDPLRHVPRIVYNGAQAIVDDETVYANPLLIVDVRFMLEWAEASGEIWYIGLEIDNTLYVNRSFAKPGHFEVANLMQLCEQPAYKMIFFFPEGRGDIEPLLAAVPPTTRSLVTPKFDIVQLCAGSADKSTALDYLLTQQGRSLDSAVAIGDDINDVEMVRCSGVGVAVENALPEVKAVADWIVPDNNADGVAFAINRLLA
jgi:Cof subfamily protein (haloacid dehalogenase superfamily)